MIDMAQADRTLRQNQNSLALFSIQTETGTPTIVRANLTHPEAIRALFAAGIDNHKIVRQ